MTVKGTEHGVERYGKQLQSASTRPFHISRIRTMIGKIVSHYKIIEKIGQGGCVCVPAAQEIKQ